MLEAPMLISEEVRGHGSLVKLVQGPNSARSYIENTIPSSKWGGGSQSQLPLWLNQSTYSYVYLEGPPSHHHRPGCRRQICRYSSSGDHRVRPNRWISSDSSFRYYGPGVPSIPTVALRGQRLRPLSGCRCCGRYERRPQPDWRHQRRLRLQLWPDLRALNLHTRVVRPDVLLVRPSLCSLTLRISPTNQTSDPRNLTMNAP